MRDMFRGYLSYFQLPKKDNSIVEMVSLSESSGKYTKAVTIPELANDIRSSDTPSVPVSITS